MKLFISYSRDDKNWVYEFKRDLQENTHHEVWIDQKIIPASDWWTTILERIEWSDCFISILTPRSADSIYCSAELAYAVAINKPVLPLVLKPCTYPAVLNTKRAQFENIAEMPLHQVLIRASVALGQVEVRLVQNQYPPVAANRPDVPKPTAKPEHAYEVFVLAEEAVAAGNDSLAESLFEQVRHADPKNLGIAASKRLGEIRHERDRAIAYMNIVRLASSPTTLRGAIAAWEVYVNQYGTYDPNGIAVSLQPSPPPPAPPIRVTPSSEPPYLTYPAKRTPTLADANAAVQKIIGEPFAWCEIPAGPFLFGDNKQQLELPAFWIAKYPITYSQFQLFVEAKDGIKDDRWWQGLAAGAEERKLAQPSWKIAKHPRETVNWYQAMAFCRWLSHRLGGNYAINKVAEWAVRLPIEAEWEKAARGTDGRIYPWGDTFDKAKCNTDASGNPKTTPVDRYPQGASPYGVLDMSGNVWEWCLSEWTNPYEHRLSQEINIINNLPRVARGCSWFDLQALARAAYRYNNNPNYRYHDGGFRVVVSAPILGTLVSGA